MLHDGFESRQFVAQRLTGADTDCSYNTSPGKLSYRDLPKESNQRVRTASINDSAGRLAYETVTRESGGSTNLYCTAYSYSYNNYHRQVVRTEQELLLVVEMIRTALRISMAGQSAWTMVSTRTGKAVCGIACSTQARSTNAGIRRLDSS